MPVATFGQLSFPLAPVRRRAVGMLLAMGCCCALCACGASGPAPASRLSPPAPINLSVYVDNGRVAVSPSRIGAGPVVLIVTNQARSAESLTVTEARGATVATTAPVNPQGTTKLSFAVSPGDYTIATVPRGGTEAERSVPSSIRPARLRVGRERPSSGNQLLVP